MHLNKSYLTLYCIHIILYTFVYVCGVKSGHAISITVHSICSQFQCAADSVHTRVCVCAFVRVYLHRSIEQVEQVMETEGMYLTAVQLSKHAGSWVMESISHTHKHLHASAHKHANSYWVMKSIKLALLLAHTYSLKIKCSSRAPKCTSTSLNLESWC